MSSVRCVSTVFSATWRRLAISLLECPSATSCSTSRWRGVSTSNGPSAAARAPCAYAATTRFVSEGLSHVSPRATVFNASSSSLRSEFLSR